MSPASGREALLRQPDEGQRWKPRRQVSSQRPIPMHLPDASGHPPELLELLEAATISIAFKLTGAAAADIARAELVISAAGMADIREDLSIVGDEVRGTIRGIPAGPDRLFTLNGYDAGGVRIYTGSTSATVFSDQQITVRITMSRISSGGTTGVVLSIISPVAATYAYNSIENLLDISAEIENPSGQTASDVNVVFTARNSSGAAMDQVTTSIGTVPPGKKFFSFTFTKEVFASRAAPASSIDYVITHSLGGPDTGTVSLSGG